VKVADYDRCLFRAVVAGGLAGSAAGEIGWEERSPWGGTTTTVPLSGPAEDEKKPRGWKEPCCLSLPEKINSYRPNERTKSLELNQQVAGSPLPLADGIEGEIGCAAATSHPHQNIRLIPFATGSAL
jgi:hypothetical protein